MKYYYRFLSWKAFMDTSKYFSTCFEFCRLYVVIILYCDHDHKYKTSVSFCFKPSIVNLKWIQEVFCLYKFLNACVVFSLHLKDFRYYYILLLTDWPLIINCAFRVSHRFKDNVCYHYLIILNFNTIFSNTYFINIVTNRATRGGVEKM